MNIPESLHNKHSFSIRKQRFHFVEYISTNNTCDNHIIADMDAIVYIQNGRKEIIADGVTYLIESHELFLLPKGKYIMSEYLPNNGAFKSIMLFFSAPHIAETVYQITTSELSKNYANKESKIQILKGTYRLELFFDSLLTIEWDDKEVFNKALLDIKLKELIFILLSDQKTKSAAMHFFIKIYYSSHQNITTVIKENLFRKTSLNSLSTMCNMSVSTFKREFQKEYGMPPLQWINSKRLEKALTLIKKTSLPITQIAHECGFENYLHFSRRFKSYFGCSASAMRTRVK